MVDLNKKLENSQVQIPKQEKKTVDLPLDVTLLQQKDRQRAVVQQDNSEVKFQLRLHKHALGGGAGLSQLSVEGMKEARGELQEAHAIELPVYQKQYKVQGLLIKAKEFSKDFNVKVVSSLHKKLRGRLSARPYEVDMPNSEHVVKQGNKKNYFWVFFLLGFILAWYLVQ